MRVITQEDDRKMSDTVSIRLTKEQAWYLRMATEACARMAVGQVGNALEMLINKDGRYCFFPYDITSALERALSPLIGLPPGGDRRSRAASRC